MIFNINLPTIRTMLNINFNGIAFKKISVLKKFLFNFSKIKFISRVKKSFPIPLTKNNNLDNSDNSDNSDNIQCKTKKYSCSSCNYFTNNNGLFTNHILVKHSSQEQRANKFTHYCKACDFGSMVTCAFTNHCATSKHIKMNSNI